MRLSAETETQISAPAGTTIGRKDSECGQIGATWRRGNERKYNKRIYRNNRKYKNDRKDKNDRKYRNERKYKNKRSYRIVRKYNKRKNRNKRNKGIRGNRKT